MKIHLISLQLCIILVTILITESMEKEREDQLDLFLIIVENVLTDNVVHHKVDYNKALKMFIKALASLKKKETEEKNHKEDEECVLSDSESSSSESDSESRENVSEHKKCIKEKNKIKNENQKKRPKENKHKVAERSREDYSAEDEGDLGDGRRSLSIYRPQAQPKHTAFTDTWSKKHERDSFTAYRKRS
ncbi:hypothetical protein ILUMI_04501 [Ignelater luminosus]|uniref:Uncharacterized protein n=1 Tax=Ignelater luminosus TaxID=2038154 RepID=A0A8K0D919_IGNLU|nr:hypothetical protein ILUMI_04501 [Ignelater luminosus]